MKKVDRFASGLNAQLPCLNSRWLEPGTEAIDCLRLPDSHWRRENNFCHPPWELLDDLMLKLRRNGAAVTVIVPHWPNRSWHQLLLTEMSTAVEIFQAGADLFLRRDRDKSGGLVPGGGASWPSEFCTGLAPPVRDT